MQQKEIINNNKRYWDENAATYLQENGYTAKLICSQFIKYLKRVHIHFSTTSNETMSDKIKRMQKNWIQQM